MCLIIFAYQVVPEYPLVLLSNRDEFYQRPSAKMDFWQDNPQILAGRDLQQGGTWLGLNTDGKFAAITNYRDGTNQTSPMLSRGFLTRQFLNTKTTAQDYLHTLPEIEHKFTGFSLLLGDSQGLYYHSNRDSAGYKQLTSGIYGLSNALLDTSWHKLNKAKKALCHSLQQGDISLDRLMSIMADTEQAKDEDLPNTGISYQWEKMLSSCFISLDSYGTRATSIILQHLSGNTLVAEQSFTAQGKHDYQQFQLQLIPVGYSQNADQIY